MASCWSFFTPAFRGGSQSHSSIQNHFFCTVQVPGIPRAEMPFPQPGLARVLFPTVCDYMNSIRSGWVLSQVSIVCTLWCANCKSSPLLAMELRPSCFATRAYLRFLIWWLTGTFFFNSVLRNAFFKFSQNSTSKKMWAKD